MTETSNTALRAEDVRRRSSEPCCDAALDSRRAEERTIDNGLTVFKALANEKRLRIVEALRRGELCACELEAILDAPQSTVASHLQKLRAAGIVRRRSEGKWTYYRIGDTASLQLLDLADALGEDA